MRQRAEQAKREFRASGADHAGKRDDLAGTQFDRDIPDPVGDGEPLGAQHGAIRAVPPAAPRRKQLAEIASDHHRDQTVRG